MSEKPQVGAALQSELERRGCALSSDEARALAISLIDLICQGLLAVPTETETVRLITCPVSLHGKDGS